MSKPVQRESQSGNSPPVASPPPAKPEASGDGSAPRSPARRGEGPRFEGVPGRLPEVGHGSASAFSGVVDPPEGQPSTAAPGARAPTTTDGRSSKPVDVDRAVAEAVRAEPKDAKGFVTPRGAGTQPEPSAPARTSDAAVESTLDSALAAPAVTDAVSIGSEVPAPALDLHPEVQAVDLRAPEPLPTRPSVEAPSKDSVPPEPQRVTPSVAEPRVSRPTPELRPVQPMYVVHITPELAPVAKVGGLADVVNGLGRELEIRGNSVEYVLPKYDCLRYDHIYALQRVYNDLWVPWFNGAVHCSVYLGYVHGRKCYFIEPHSRDRFFERGHVYGSQDDLFRFAFFSRAAMEFLFKSGKHPEIIHCHDWPTGLVPVMLFEIYKFLGMGHSRVCYTIHNFKHQGVGPEDLLRATGLNRPEYYLHADRLLDPRHRAVNMMKAGIVYSNFVTTVSPRHAWEAKHGQGFGLEPTLHTHHVKYGGVVNGVDYDVWNPEIDRYLPRKYGVESIELKYESKRALRQRLWLADNEKPIVAFVGRLDPQKGLDLIRHALWYCLHNRAQFVLLGNSPDNAINNSFWALKRQINDSPDCHIEVSFNEELSHLVYAGADMILVPSQFEPCGLAQMIGLRYGTIPIVRAVGGLADTVIDKDFSSEPLDRRNGYVFDHYTPAGLESALGRALACYYQYPDHFRHLMINAMRSDYSWAQPGQHYLNIYDYIRDK